MLNIMIPKELLNWMYTYKGVLSLPSLTIKCIAYVMNSGISIEELIETTEQKRNQKRGINNEGTKGSYRKGEDINITTM